MCTLTENCALCRTDRVQGQISERMLAQNGGYCLHIYIVYTSKKLYIYINNNRHLVRKYAWLFVCGHFLFREANSFPRANCELRGQIISKDKYPSIFSTQMEAIVLIILQIFFATRTVLKTEEYSWIFPSFSWGIFGHVTRLDQSRMSKKI